ncbi:hypothetical protein FQA39_LY00530 [Lamprigera yunnana]|nr:hypothetical protein FQA39_LY00530 [Lamprigera yunnana]
MSAYIMQDDLLPQLMSVDELMMIAAKLKLGDKVSIESKQATINEILDALGLDSCRNVRTESLSGGQKKRLSSYFLANGICVYNGSTPDIVPHLSTIGITCPVTYTPAEYIIELVHDNENFATALSAAVQNGKLNKRPNSSNSVTNYRPLAGYKKDIYEDTVEKLSYSYPTSFWSQFCILYCRMLLQLTRNRTGIALQLFSHTVAAVLLGLLYFGIGNNAEMAIENFFFCVGVFLFFIFTYLMRPALTYPEEIKILKREYFNRWYTLKPYYLAVTLQNIPVLTTLGILVMLSTYAMTYQPLDVARFFYFVLTGLLVAVTTEGLGLAVGSTFNVGNGTVVASAVVAPLVLLCFYGAGYGNKIEPYMKVIMGISYVRFAAVAGMTAIFENRGPFDCFNEIFCYYKDPKQILRDLGMLNASYSLNMLALFCYGVLFRMIAFFAINDEDFVEAEVIERDVEDHSGNEISNDVADPIPSSSKTINRPVDENIDDIQTSGPSCSGLLNSQKHHHSDLRKLREIIKKEVFYRNNHRHYL